MKLMMPLAGDRSSEGTTSGIKAITGPREIAIAMFMNKITINSATNGRVEYAITGMRRKKRAPSGKPVIMKGILFPIGVLVLSDKAPIKGMSIIASILSRFITQPVR